MSSHREAPQISTDPVADSTDVYAFVSPDDSDTVTLIANYVPLQAPAGGPNFYEFGDDVLYEIHIDNDKDATPDITYQFRFQTRNFNPDTFLYNTGPITSLTSKSWNRRQFYSVTRVREGEAGGTLLASGLACPPCNIGPRSTPNYLDLVSEAIHPLPGGGKVFAGQRAEGFYIDLGSVFDLGALRPIQALHLIPMANTMGVDTTRALNVHSIAIQVPIEHLTRDGSRPKDVLGAASVIGVYTSASRQRVQVRHDADDDGHVGPWMQVSRLGNPLFNEVIVPLVRKDEWNRSRPTQDSKFAKYVLQPELARLLPVLYPTAFPNLATKLNGKPRDDLAAVLLTGIPPGVVPGFQNTTGATLADLLRLNLAVPPSSSPNILGLVAGDAAGFPNGRRVFDDTTTVELRALAGLTYKIVHPSYTLDAAVSAVTDGLDNHSPKNPYLSHFPYLGTPYDGFHNPSA